MSEQIICGECDRPLVDNPATDNTLPYYCPSCDIVYDWEDLEVTG